MPQSTELDNNDEIESTWSDTQSSDSKDGQINPWLSNWTHFQQNLLSMPSVFNSTPFLPWASNNYTTNPLFAFAPLESDLAGTFATRLPDLGVGDEWVMVDPYWRHQLLGWVEHKEYESSESRSFGVSGTTIQVGNLLYDPEDTDHMNLKGYVYLLFRPAGLIRDIWVPVDQERPDRSNVVVVFALQDAVGRALAMPPKRYSDDDGPQIITVTRRYTEHCWYPAPRSRVAALEAHVLNKRTTSINAIMWRDPELATIETDYSLPSVSPPKCRPFSEMPKKYRFRTFFGFDTLDTVRLFGPTSYDRHVPPLFHPSHTGPPTAPSAEQDSTQSPTQAEPKTNPEVPGPRRRRVTFDHRGLPIRRLRTSRRAMVDPSSITPNSGDFDSAAIEDTDDQPRIKKVRFDDGDTSHRYEQNVSDVGHAAKTETGYLDDIVQAQIGLNEISAKVSREGEIRSRGLYMKRKAGELDEEDPSDSEASVMDMEIDD